VCILEFFLFFLLLQAIVTVRLIVLNLFQARKVRNLTLATCATFLVDVGEDFGFDSEPLLFVLQHQN
jgi:hypothetical protein